MPHRSLKPHFGSHPLTNDKLNVTFEKLLFSSEPELRKWGLAVRNFIGDEWKRHGAFPDNGTSAETCAKALKGIRDGQAVLKRDMRTGNEDCIRHRDPIGSVTHAFFPNIGKVGDSTSTTTVGKSLWDYFTAPDPQLIESWLKKVDRHFRTDGFFAFAKVVMTKGNKVLYDEKSGEAWLRRFKKDKTAQRDYGIFVEALDKKITRHKGKSPLTISDATLKSLLRSKALTKQQMIVAHYREPKPTHRYRIRYYKKKERVFPVGFGFFQKGLVLSATNFPPLVAKFLYEKYTDSKKRSVIYDPSAGFGGRLIAALAVSANRKIHYIGTDPNSEHFSGKHSVYEELADFYKKHVHQNNYATTEFYMLGSEVIGSDKSFQKWRGKVDFVFTSPPYFGAEAYANEGTQSFKKFPEYENWRDGFLRTTLTTAVRWLQKGGHLAWNIADTRVNGVMQPLERDSINILTDELGMKMVATWKMLLAKAPGAKAVRNRSKFEMPYKNTCIVGGVTHRYEPIFVFQKK